LNHVHSFRYLICDFVIAGVVFHSVHATKVSAGVKRNVHVFALLYFVYTAGE